MQAAGPTTLAPPRANRASAGSLPVRAGVLRVLGALGLLGVLAALVAIELEAAAAPTPYVPSDTNGWPAWLAGPLRGAISTHLTPDRFQLLIAVMSAGYLIALASARWLGVRALAAAVLLAHVAVLLGPPLLSQDVFGYLSFARLGALHGLDPYTHIPAEAPKDPTFGFIGWPLAHSPYGPLFTLASYATAPLGLAAGLWSFKALAAVCSLLAIWFTARATERNGGSAASAVALLGLNPVLLVLAVGGAHNDMLLLALAAAALLLSAGAAARPRAAAVALAAGVGVKLTAGLLLPFLVLGARGWRERWRIAVAGALGLAAVAVIGVIGFGPHVLGFLGAIGEQQEMVATHSVPAETARLFGLSGTPGWWRGLWGATFLIVLAFALWRTARGADWRIAGGWTTLALLLGTAWLLPWYAVWVLPLAAVGNDRRLRWAAILFCAYAMLIHLPFANPVLSPGASRVVPRAAVSSTGKGLELAGLEVLRHVHLDLRW